MAKRLAFPVLLVLVALGALLFRIPRLTDRPFHGDEAIHAYKFNDEVFAHHTYKYDPHEYHGPTIYYFALPVFWLTGTTYATSNEATFRMVPVIFGAATILLLWLVRDGLGTVATICAAVLLAVSSPLVFYSRYYIQETLMAFFILGAIAAGWRWINNPRVGWVVLFGVCAGLAHATKETWVLSAAAAVFALGGTWLWHRSAAGNTVDGRWKVEDGPGRASSSSNLLAASTSASIRASVAKAILLAAVIALAVGLTILSTFWTHPRGALDSLLTFLHYARRTGSGVSLHDQPWYYYIQILGYHRYGFGAPLWTEAAIFALAAGVALNETANRRNGERANKPAADSPIGPCAHSCLFVRYLILYALFQWLFYSLISYKTPWCILAFWQPTILLAGVGMSTIITRGSRMVLWSLLVFGLLAAATVGGLSLIDHFPAHKANWPRITWQVWTIIAAVGALSVAAGFLPAPVLRILLVPALAFALYHQGEQSWRSNYSMSSDWRNPWVHSHPMRKMFDITRRIDQVAAVAPEKNRILIKGFTKDIWPLPYYLRNYPNVGYWDHVPDDVDAAVILCEPEQLDQVNERAKARYHHSIEGLRPTVTRMLLIREDLWQAFLKTRSPGATSPR